MNLVAQYDKTVLPHFYGDRFPQFAAMVDAYYTWAEEHGPKTIEANRNIDTVEDAFVDHLLAEITSNFPVASGVDKKLVGRYAREVFRARGTGPAVEQLFRLMFAVDADVVYPGDKVFAASADKYVEIEQIEVDNDTDLYLYVNKVVSTTSGGQFSLRSVKQISANNRRHTIAEIEDVVQPVNIGDQIFYKERSPSNATVLGSAGYVIVKTPKKQTEKYSEVIITGASGGVGKGLVTEVSNASHQIITNMISGGSAYTATPEINISDTILLAPSATITSLDIGQDVHQDMWWITVDSNFVATVGANTRFYQEGVSNQFWATLLALVPSPGGHDLVYDFNHTNSGTYMPGEVTIAFDANNDEWDVTIVDKTATGYIVGQHGSEVGIANTTGTFLPTLPIQGLAANIVAQTVSTINACSVAVTSLGATMPVLVAEPFDPVFANTDTQQITYSGDDYRMATIGTIDQITVECSSETIDPIITINQPMTLAGNTVYEIEVGAGDKFVGGETLVHTSNTNAVALTLNTTFFNQGDVVASPSVGAATFIGIVRTKDNEQIFLGDIQGTIDVGDVLVNANTTKSVEVMAKTTASSRQMITGMGRITDIDGNTLTVRVAAGVFVNGGEIYGRVSNHYDTITSLSASSDTLRGENFDVEINNYSNERLITKVKVTDPGVGFTHNQLCTMYDLNGDEVATGIVVVQPIAKTAQKQALVRSGVSQNSFIHDNLYYQSHSYEIKSPLSFDMYSQAVKRYTHVSGTVMFGSVEINNTLDHTAIYSSEIVEQE